MPVGAAPDDYDKALYTHTKPVNSSDALFVVACHLLVSKIVAYLDTFISPL